MPGSLETLYQGKNSCCFFTFLRKNLDMEMVKLHNNIFLGIDIFHINGLAFFIVASSKLNWLQQKKFTART